MSLRKLSVIVVLIVLVGAGVFLFSASSVSPMDSFAKCLNDKGAAMYGAFWCPHCAEQKEKFGQSFKYVKYVECGVPGQPPRVQTPACQQMQIKKYPTWVFSDGDRMEAVESLQALSQKTGCKLP
jgi:hypothetical protein